MSIQIICTTQFKTTPPPLPGIPQAFDWSFVPYSGEFDPKCAPPLHPSQAFDFMPKHWSALQAKGFSLFWLCLVGYLHLNKQFDAWENF